jgi:hypothetical protein
LSAAAWALLLLTGLLALAACLGSAAPASAATTSDRHLLFSFDGSDTAAGAFSSLRALDVDQANGIVYVIDEGRNVVDKFNLAGEAQSFSGTIGSSLDPGFTFNSYSDVAVDNSSVHPGRLHVLREFGPLKAFDPTGTELWELGGFGDACGLAVDAEGHVWIGDYEKEIAQEFAAEGSPPAELGAVPLAPEEHLCRLDVDASGNLYVNLYEGAVEKYEGGVKGPTLDPGSARGVSVDQSSTEGHVFVLHGEAVNEFDSSGTLISRFGEGAIGNGQGIAYYKALDRVYVADAVSGTVRVFGPLVTGTVPDLTIEPVTDIGLTTAQLNGTVNAQGTANSWHFEWKTPSQTWDEAESSPAQSVPADSNDHAVSFEATGLQPNAAYEVRLVAFNTDLDLKSVSATETFDNVRASVTTLPAAPRTDTTARLNARIDSGGHPVTFRFEYSLDGSSWTPLPDRELTAGPEPVVVSEELTGLDPATTYLFRAIAETELGPAIPQGEAREFTTRTSAEVSDPSPCPNEAVRLIQHSTYLGGCRAIELVNSPDKGNQHAVAFQPENGPSPASPDGEEVIWSVFGGAPGGTTGTNATFMAERTPSGWISRSLIPPTSRQVGDGAFKYTLPEATPDFTKFVFVAGSSVFGSSGTPTVGRLDSNQTQEALQSYPNSSIPAGPGIGVTDDAAHVFFVNPETGQLEDIGTGEPEVLSLMPDGTPSECGLGDAGLSFLGAEGSGRGAGMNWHPGYARFSVTDGSRVYFQARPNGDCGGKFGLYQRNRDTGVTTLIDPGAGDRDSYMIRSTRDGRSIYFTTYSELDPADANSHPDVYRWDEGSGAVCLTCVVPDAHLLTNALDPQGVLVSDDFSHIYFLSEKQLVPGLGTPGHANIYVLSDGELRFVADTADRNSERNMFGLGLFDGSSTNARLSPDGNTLLFRTAGVPSLTSDRVAEECPRPDSLSSPAACKQLYRYDDRDGSVECVSCIRGGITESAVASGAKSLRSPGFNMSADGTTVAFVTAAPLLSRDINRSADIYEWRNGVVHLLTDGASKFPESLFGAPAVRSVSADGRDIVFSLVDPGRTGFERDGLANLYDARLGGGFMPPPAPVRCSEESCQGPLKSAPGLDRAATAGIAGHGNQVKKPRRPCARKHGRAKRRCLRKHRSKHRSHRRAADDNARGSK